MQNAFGGANAPQLVRPDSQTAAPDGSSANWVTTVAPALQNAGFKILYPSPSAQWTGLPDANGNYLEMSWTAPKDWTPAVPHFVVDGDTGFGGAVANYLEQAGGGLIGDLSGSATIGLKVLLGVDDHGFFVSGTNALSINLTASTSTNLGGTLSIGDLASVTAKNGVAKLGVSAAVGFQPTATDPNGKVRVSDLTQSLSQVVTGTLTGSASLTLNFDTQLAMLPDIAWSGTFAANIQNSGVTLSVNLTAPSVQNLLSSIGGQLFSLGNGIPVLGPLANSLNQPLPLINTSIGQLTGLNAHLPTLPSLPSSFSSLNGSYPLAGGTLNVNVTPTTIDQFLHGKNVNLVSWTASGNVDLADFNLTVPIFSIGVPGIASAEIDATFGLHATLHYDLGFGLDTNGFWVRRHARRSDGRSVLYG